MAFPWVALAMLVVSTVVSAMLAPKPKDAEPSSLGEFQAPTAEEGRPISMLLGTVKIKGPNVTWWGALRTEAIKRVANALTGSRTIIGYRYRLGMQHVLAVAPVDELVDIVVGDKSLSAAGASISTLFNAAGADLSINLPQLFGGDEKEGGLQGNLRFYFGSDTQNSDPYLVSQFGVPAPAWRGICYAVLKDFYLGTSNYPKEWAWVLRGCPCPAGLDPTKRNLDGDANPSYGLAHILTQPQELGGCGEALGTLDLATFQSAGNTLFAEGFGISLLMDRSQSADAWIGEILRHIDGVLYTDPATGLTSLKLLRADYDPATLPEFTEADIQDAPEITQAAPPDTINRIVIRYVDRAQAFTTRTAQAQDAGNYWARGEGASTTMDFLGLSKASLAQYVAAREMRPLASPLPKGSLLLNRKGWALRPGSPFKLTFGPQGWSGLICRVTNIRYGTLGAGKITVEFAQDVFSVGGQAYAPPGGSSWTDPVTTPQPCAAQALLEAPCWVSGASRQVFAMGARADAATLGAEIWTNEGAGYLLTGGLPSMTPTGLLTAAYSAKTAALDTVGFTIQGGSDLAQLLGFSTNADGRNRGQNLAWFSATGEIISWTTATDNLDGTYTIAGNLRGVLDTVPADQALGSRVWFISAGAADVQATEGGSGTPGAPGSPGLPGASGRGYTWRGAWVSTTAYVVDDTVSRNGSSYVSILAGTGHDPETATTYWSLMAQRGADGTSGGGGGQPDYLAGLELTWNSGSSLTVQPGAAYLEGPASVLTSATAITKSSLSLSANTWYHLYLWSNSGTPDVELSTTVPAAPFRGTARSKTGDATRRYLGSVRTSTTGALYRFRTKAVGSALETHWVIITWAEGPFRLLSGGTATSPTNVSVSGIMPCAAVSHLSLVATLFLTAQASMAYGISAEMDASASYPELTAELYGSLSSGLPFSAGHFYLPAKNVMLDQGGTNIQYMMRPGVGTGCNLSIDCTGMTVLR